MKINPGFVKNLLSISLLAVSAMGCAQGGKFEVRPMDVADETPVFITIGQSNADGSAEFDPQEDARLRSWYESDSNSHTMKIWYRSSYIVNQPDGARWVFDGKETDVEPGWLDLWYRNENTSGRTAMNMIHGYGTWSTGDDFSCAQGRRGMEGQFGLRYQTAYPGKDLYIVKLGCSGSQIATWTGDSANNWNYFLEKMWKPAVSSLLAEGKKPRLAGIWWMQGCGDQNQSADYYTARLTELINACRDSLGFPDAQVYIGRIVKPGDSPTNPEASRQFGQGVRDAQVAVTTPGSPTYIPGTELIVTDSFPFQGDQLHFNHVGVNMIGNAIADRVIAAGPEGWASYTTPGHWSGLDTRNPVFTPSVGNPEISYKVEGDNVSALLDYGTWSEIKTAALIND